VWQCGNAVPERVYLVVREWAAGSCASWDVLRVVRIISLIAALEQRLTSMQWRVQIPWVVTTSRCQTGLYARNRMCFGENIQRLLAGWD